MDLAQDDSAVETLRARLSDVEVLPISGATRRGIDPLLERVWRVLEEDRSRATPSADASTAR
jgi:hypothetical protein